MTNDPIFSREDLSEHTEWLRALVRGLVTDPHQADDIVQDTLLAGLARPPSSRERFRAWLVRVSRNLAFRSHRSQTHRRDREEAAALPESSSRDLPDALLMSRSEREVLVDAVMQLPEPYRRTIVMRYWQDLRSPEIAAQLQVSDATVRSRLMRASEMLRQRLDRHYRGERGHRASAWLLFLQAGESSPSSAPMSVAKSAVAMGTAGVVLLTVVAINRNDASESSHQTTHSSSTIGLVENSAAVAETLPVTRDEQAPSTRNEGVSKARTLAVTGRVTDEMGVPLEGATIRVGESLDPWLETRAAVTPVSVTDGSGQFRLEAMPEQLDAAELEVLAPEHATHRLRPLDLSDGSTDVGAVVLHPATTVTGVVRDDNGNAVVGARLYLCVEAGPVSPMEALFLRPAGFTGPDGRFEVEGGVPPGELPHLLIATAPKGIGWVEFPVVRGRESITTPDLTLRPSGNLAVQVKSSNGEPVPDARLVALPHFAPLGPLMGPFQPRRLQAVPLLRALQARTDATGRATFQLPIPEGPGAGGYDLFVTSVGHCRSVVAGLDLESGRTIDCIVDLAPASKQRLAGVVRDPSGRPIVGATVQGDDRGSISDDEGRFDLGDWDLTEHHEVLLTASAEGWTTLRQRAELTPDTIELELGLKPGRCLAGRVIDPKERGIEGASVVLEVPGEPIVSWRTGPDGRFRFEGLGEGPYQMWVTPPGDRSRDVQYSVLEKASESLRIVVAADEAPATGSLLLSIVHHETHEPLDPARVYFDPVGDRLADPRVGRRSGEVELEGLAPGTWRVLVRTTDGWWGEAEYEIVAGAAARRERMHIGPPARITCRYETEEPFEDDEMVWLEVTPERAWRSFSTEIQTFGIQHCIVPLQDGVAEFPVFLPGRTTHFAIRSGDPIRWEEANTLATAEVRADPGEHCEVPLRRLPQVSDVGGHR